MTKTLYAMHIFEYVQCYFDFLINNLEFYSRK